MRNSYSRGSRKYNFSAGPAALPTSVLERAQEELLDWQGQGFSALESSHRSPVFLAMAERAEQRLRQLLAVPDDYATLFLQGGATLQFSAVPLNLASADASADYAGTGYWSAKAFAEGRRLCAARQFPVVQANQTGSGEAGPERKAGGKGSQGTQEAQGMQIVTPPDLWPISDKATYVHYTANETIDGIEFRQPPDSGEIPLVADMSSTIFSYPLDVRRFGVIYAGAQKNFGPAGLTLVVVRRDLLERARPDVPALLHWKRHEDNGSMYNTPPTFAWYLASLMFEWMERQGGLEVMAELSERKAVKLYQAIDNSDFYSNDVPAPFRSRMNVPFQLADEALEKAFLDEAEAADLCNLAGHRSVGGMRASLYNAVPLEAVDALVAFMQDFEQGRG